MFAVDEGYMKLQRIKSQIGVAPSPPFEGTPYSLVGARVRRAARGSAFAQGEEHQE